MSSVIFNRRRTLSVALTAAVLAAGLWFMERAEAGTSVPPGEGITAVFIASGASFPDALGVGPIAAVNGAPIILVPPNPPLDPATVAELERLDPQFVAIIGGTATISTATEDALMALLPNASFERLAGANRYATSALISAATFPVETVMSVPPVAFSAANPATETATVSPAGAYSAVTLYAPVHLPDGARLVQMILNADDTDGGDGVGVRLRRMTFNTDQVIADAFTGDAYAGGHISAGDSSLTADTELVDNSLYSYYLEMYASEADRRVLGVTIVYQLGTP